MKSEAESWTIDDIGTRDSAWLPAQRAGVYGVPTALVTGAASTGTVAAFLATSAELTVAGEILALSSVAVAATSIIALPVLAGVGIGGFIANNHIKKTNAERLKR